MIRVLLFFIVVFALGLGFAWLAERPGQLVITFGGYQYEVTLMVAAALVTAVVAAVMITWWVIKSLWNSPYTIARYFRVRRRDRGYQALSTGIVAVGAGDAALARRMNRQAAKLINSDQEPLIHLLDAQASLLEGDHEAARKKFEAMLEDPEMRLLGLRGLFLEAERLGDRNASQHYAERASELAPQLGWATDATLEARTAAADWDGALRLLDARKTNNLIARGEADRKRAILLTAKAISTVDADPLTARNAATEAVRLAPDLVPAAVVAAKALFKLGDVRKGAKVLESAWRKEAHPEIADAYVHARHGDSVQDRLARAKRLRAQRQNNAEAELAVARAALAAGEFRTAREAAESAIRLDPREGAYLLLADIEEAETGEQGKIRHWLAKAVRAPRDPIWVADGMVSERWLPFSPVTGRLDAFEWRPPVAKAGTLIERWDREIEAPLLPPAAKPEPALFEEAEIADGAAASPGLDTIPHEAPAPEPLPDGEQRSAERASAANDDARSSEELVRIPDDPGVGPEDEEAKKATRFRLF
jgi:HemY protein